VDAIQWLGEYLNSGVILSGIALVEQNRLLLRAHRMTEGSGEILYYDQQVQISLQTAEFFRIDLDGSELGIISSAQFEAGDNMRLEVSLTGGGFSVGFSDVQVSERIAHVYSTKVR
jgi:hypothetical protein